MVLLGCTSYGVHCTVRAARYELRFAEHKTKQTHARIQLLCHLLRSVEYYYPLCERLVVSPRRISLASFSRPASLVRRVLAAAQVPSTSNSAKFCCFSRLYCPSLFCLTDPPGNGAESTVIIITIATTTTNTIPSHSSTGRPWRPLTPQGRIGDHLGPLEGATAQNLLPLKRKSPLRRAYANSDRCFVMLGRASDH